MRMRFYGFNLWQLRSSEFAQQKFGNSSLGGSRNTLFSVACPGKTPQASARSFTSN